MGTKPGDYLGQHVPVQRGRLVVPAAVLEGDGKGVAGPGGRNGSVGMRGGDRQPPPQVHLGLLVAAPQPGQVAQPGERFDHGGRASSIGGSGRKRGQGLPQQPLGRLVVGEVLVDPGQRVQDLHPGPRQSGVAVRLEEGQGTSRGPQGRRMVAAGERETSAPMPPARP